MRPLEVVVRNTLSTTTSGAARLFPIAPTHTIHADMESNCRLRKDHAGIALPAELHEEARTRKPFNFS